METSSILFCNTPACNLKNDQEKSDILRKIVCKYKVPFDSSSILYNASVMQRFLSRFQYFITTINGGDRYWLYLTQFKHTNYTFLIHKSLQTGYSFPKIIIINARFNSMLYNDTLFECELVRSGSRWQLQLADIKVYRGQPTSSVYATRYKQMSAIVTYHYKPDAYIFKCDIVVKKVFNYDFSQLDHFLQNCQYNVVGVSFISCSGHRNIDFYFKKQFIPPRHKIRLEFLKRSSSELQEACRQEEFLLKSIMNEDDSPDTASVPTASRTTRDARKPETSTFIAQSTRFPNIYILYTKGRGPDTILSKHSIARIDTIECAAMMESIFQYQARQQPDAPVWIDCVYDSDFHKWVPYQLSARRVTGAFTPQQDTDQDRGEDDEETLDSMSDEDFAI